MLRYIAKDTSSSATPYGQVTFPREALKKLGHFDMADKVPFSVCVRVHVFGGKAAALSEAVGTHVSVTNGKATYGW
jgi:hypothetical protein